MYRSGHATYRSPKRTWAFQVGLDWRVKFLLPVRPGDLLRYRITVQGKRPSSKPGRGIVFCLNEMFHQEERVVLACEMVLLLSTRPSPES